MKLAISNIAWPVSRDAEVAALLSQHGVGGIEVAPPKVWPKPLEATAAQLREYRAFWADRGIRIAALQGLLFGRDDLTIFESEDRRREMLHYLTGMMDVAAALGAEVLVFGSPKNRRIGALDPSEAMAIATSFFAALGEAAHARGVAFCIEPNASVYGCDFVTTTADGAALVRRVATPGFALHLDAGGLAINDEPAGDIEEALPLVRHVHISEPQLMPVGGGPVGPIDSQDAHARLAAVLREGDYAHWVSIEMREPAGDFTLEPLAAALRYAAAVYAAPSTAAVR